MKGSMSILLLTLLFSYGHSQNTVAATGTLCGEALSATYHPAPSAGGDFSFNVTAPATCTYSISTPAPFILVTSPPTATGNSTVTYFVPQNLSLVTPRVGVIVVGARTFTVNQAKFEGGNHVRTALDFNFDTVSDFVVIQNNSGQMTWWSYRFHITPGASTTVVSWGLFDIDIPLPMDYDGDFRADFAVWRPGPSPGTQGHFYILNSGSGTVRIVPWGLTGDDPNITQDFDGDSKADIAVTRVVGPDLIWYIHLTADNRIFIIHFGTATDRPIRGDYDGDYHSDIAVYRTTATPINTFFVLRSSNDQITTFQFGNASTDVVVPGDYNGDMKTDYAVWGTTTGIWRWMTGPGGTGAILAHGTVGDLPVPGDYNNDYRSDYAVWRPSTGQFLITGGDQWVTNLRWGSSTMKAPGYSMQVR